MKENSTLNHLKKLKNKLKEGKELAINVNFEIEKTERLIESLKQDPVKVVLIGSFSTGKTCVLAGLLNRYEDGMKIDIDESTDDITCHPYNGNGYEIIDTPGLFGIKKTIYDDNEEIKLSDLTKKYISEAHVVLLVTTANPPIRESHFSMIKYILRDLGKLDSTIFVINRLDDTGISMSDESQYRTMCANKKNSLISQLRECINLSKTEESGLKVACVAADPGEKGAEYWMKEGNKEKYEVRSHMETLRVMIDDFVKESDVQRLKQETLATSVNEIITTVCNEIDVKQKGLKSLFDKMMDNQNNAVKEKNDFYSRTEKARSAMCSNIEHYFSNLKSSLHFQNHETLPQFLIEKIGVSADGKSLSFEKVTLEVNDIVSTNRLNVSDELNNCFHNLNNLDLELKSLFDYGLKQLNGKIPIEINVNAEDIKSMRKIFNPKYKFKPYEAKKMAEIVGERLTMASKIGGTILAIAPELFKIIKSNRDEKKAQKLISDVHTELEKREKAILDELQIDNYINQFAPEYHDMIQRLKEKERDIQQYQNYYNSLTKYYTEIKELEIK